MSIRVRHADMVFFFGLVRDVDPDWHRMPSRRRHEEAGAAPAAGLGNVGDLQSVLNNAVLLWDFTQTQVFICPLMLAGAGGGAFGAIAQNAAGANSGSMGNGNGGIWMYRRHPVALPGNSTFAVLVQFGSRASIIGANPAGIAVRVVLLGYYKSVIELG